MEKKRRNQKIARTWQLQNAKSSFSKVMRLAQTEGPQLITRKGKEEVVVIPVSAFDELIRSSRKPEPLSKFFADSPLFGLNLNIERDNDTDRESA